MSDEWTPPGYVVVEALVGEHGKGKMRDDLFSGRRQAYAWDRNTGCLRPIEPTSWGASEAGNWLSGTQSVKGADGEYISECRVLVKEEEDAKPRPPEGAYLSPYMQLMLDANRRFAINEDRWPKKEVLEEHFRAQKLPDGRPVSSNRASQLATLCRPLAAQLGGNKKG
jgi:hypothetical protein